MEQYFPYVEKEVAYLKSRNERLGEVNDTDRLSRE